MIDALYIGATGMHAQQMNIDVISNNLANVNTAGFKRNRVDFEDLLYRTIASSNTSGSQPVVTNRLGMGTTVSATGKVYTAGDLKQTNEALDFSIRGQGFFEVALPDGTSGYTRNGAFKLNEEGMLVTQDGHKLSAQVQVPPDSSEVTVEPDGRILVTLAGESRPVEIGQLELAGFVNPSGLNPVGDNLYLATTESGDVLHNRPGENGSGTIAQGFLEASNVRLIDEMVSLIVAQRAYEINAKVVQASDELLSISNNLFR
jgi:flagellar basal-body rod protein FlgG